ncbi:alpha-amylase [Streptomyces sp. TRM43335]|uniref:Alpha-amylase n=1 Tax=Streptomyces taklimakanensis TaxID=2569853 RepID=A0A6G2BAC8_9ACTN|nr:alpha-amylase [Streptomyces taklimakanensis]
MLCAGIALGSPARAAEEPHAGESSAPSCLRYSAGWRYTFVTNDCDTVRHLTVEYSDGRTVPCRTAAPRETVTFPGHGFGTGVDVTGVRACPAVPS